MRTILLATFFVVLFSAIHCIKTTTKKPDGTTLRRGAALRCIVETQVRLLDVRRILALEFFDPDDRAKEFLKCYVERLGIFEGTDGRNNINEEVLSTHLDDVVNGSSQVEGIVDVCKVEDKGEKSQEFVFKLYKCLFDKVHKEPGLINVGSTSFGDELQEAYEKLKEKKTKSQLTGDDDYLDISLDKLEASFEV